MLRQLHCISSVQIFILRLFAVAVAVAVAAPTLMFITSCADGLVTVAVVGEHLVTLVGWYLSPPDPGQPVVIMGR